MDFLEFAKERYSVRSFSQQPIEDEKMQKILQAGQVAPTALNFQPQKIYVLKSEDALEKIRFLTKYAYNAPVVLLVCADERKAWHSRHDFGFSSGQMDASIVCTHMMLEAWRSGKSGWMGQGIPWRMQQRKSSRFSGRRSSQYACFPMGLSIQKKAKPNGANSIIPTVLWRKW